jgi:hypothetical protein
MAVLTCGSLGWPAPSMSFFATAAEIDATLLVAVSVGIAAPSGWRRTLQDHFAFVAGGILMAALGLGASITGAVSNRPAEVLLVLAVSPVLPVLMALLVGAYDRLREIETRHEGG